MPCEPGFTKAAFMALETKSQLLRDQGKEPFYSLMVDEMSIKKFVSWDGHKFRGYVDLGADMDTDDEGPLAKDVLVFMVVSLVTGIKVPCGFFMVCGLSGNERANLVRVCIEKLHAVDVKVVALISDGPPL